MFGWHLSGLDYEMAYINAPLDEECYMRAPTCFREVDPDGNEYFYSIKRCLYGHPASSRGWNEHLVKALQDAGYQQH